MFQPRRELLIVTLFVLVVEVLAAWTRVKTDRSLLWRPAWARLRGGSGPAYDATLAARAFDRVLARPIGPDHRAVVALAEREELDRALSGLDGVPPDRLVFDAPYRWAGVPGPPPSGVPHARPLDASMTTMA
ncbi:hypothetical protein ACWKT3_03970 [Streptomyces violaceus]